MASSALPLIDNLQSTSVSNFSPPAPSELNRPTSLALHKSEPAKLETEQIRMGVQKVEEKFVYTVITFPTYTIVTNAVGENSSYADVIVESKVGSVNGVNTGFNLTDQIRFPPGDYCFGFSFRSAEEAKTIQSIRMQVKYETISNMVVCQLIFGLYNALGFEPSQTLRLTARSTNQTLPFYRKTRNEIAELSIKVETLSKLNEQVQDGISKISLSRQGEKGSPETPVVKLTEIETLVQQKKLYHDKLLEAEDYIEHLVHQQERPSKSRSSIPADEEEDRPARSKQSSVRRSFQGGTLLDQEQEEMEKSRQRHKKK